MDDIINELWETILQTCPILAKEWVKSCFQNDEDAAIREINESLTDVDSWTDRSANFLLRLVSSWDSSGNYKPRVQLALMFVQHMSRSLEFTAFVRTTLNVGVQRREENHVARSLPIDGSEKRGNGLLHEAAKSGRCEDLQQFLSQRNVNALNNIGETVLHLAAEFEHPQDVTILLRAHATFQVTVDILSWIG